MPRPLQIGQRDICRILLLLRQKLPSTNEHIDAAVMIYKSEIFLFNLNQKKIVKHIYEVTKPSDSGPAFLVRCLKTCRKVCIILRVS